MQENQDLKDDLEQLESYNDEQDNELVELDRIKAKIKAQQEKEL